MFRGALGVPNFFVTSLFARNCIQSIKLLAISKTAKLEFFSYFWSKLWYISRALGVPNFFVVIQCVRNCIPTIKLLAISKMVKLEFFFRIFGVNQGSLGVFHGALSVPNIFVASLWAKNCIPTIKLVAISKTAKL